MLVQKKLNVGTLLDSTASQTDNGTIEKYCYNDETTNCTAYGGFYQWDEAMQYYTTIGAQGICPTGWHIPTNAQLHILEDAVASDGNALKAIGEGDSDGVGTNTSGFSALLAGDRAYNSFFNALGYYTTFWSSDQFVGIVNVGYLLVLRYNNSIISINNGDKSYGFSVRCLKN